MKGWGGLFDKSVNLWVRDVPAVIFAFYQLIYNEVARCNNYVLSNKCSTNYFFNRSEAIWLLTFIGDYHHYSNKCV